MTTARRIRTALAALLAGVFLVVGAPGVASADPDPCTANPAPADCPRPANPDPCGPLATAVIGLVGQVASLTDELAVERTRSRLAMDSLTVKVEKQRLTIRQLRQKIRALQS